jgi:Cu/Ag efflux pump CusA
VFSQDLEKNEAIAEAVVDVMKTVPGVADLGHFKSLGQPSIKTTPSREACARYGLNTGDVDAVIQAAIGGQAGRDRSGGSAPWRTTTSGRSRPTAASTARANARTVSGAAPR